MWAEIINDLAAYDIYEWTILLTGLVYAVFSMLNKPICWVFGIISCAFLAYKDFTAYNLFFDGGLQIIYVLLGFSGLYKWMKKSTNEFATTIQSLPFISHVNALIQGVLVALVLVVVVRMFRDPAYATLDSITTVFSIWATWLLVNRVYETWIYWLVINVVYVYIYIGRGADLVAVLYIIYFLTAVGGLYAWKREQKVQLSVANS